ncbi:hypothetical protein GJU94_15270 [Brucella sp. 10RB9214]|uniref:hypothetical protein n=1 Tax=Brucella sp. 10RB9214 TaxID=1844040 RepID=UPI0012ADB17B|nr:hypothetical protein [Brucella sp. 10RB9214]MRN51168.1 hypothetical protein [Brucella sp. 10RB9214]
MKRPITNFPDVFGICLQKDCVIYTPNGLEWHSIPSGVDRKAFLKELIDNRERLINEKKLRFRVKRFIRVTILQFISNLTDQISNVLRRWFGAKPSLEETAIDSQIGESCSEQCSIDVLHIQAPLVASNEQLRSESKRRGKAGVA